MLQDPSAPNFVSEVVTLFCQDGERIIGELAKQLYVWFLTRCSVSVIGSLRCGGMD